MVPPDVTPLPDRFGPAFVQPSRPNGFELVVSAGIEFVLTAALLGVIGAIVYSVAPDFTVDGVEYLHGEPGEAFIYGLGAYVATIVGAVLLAITIVGLVVVVPALIVLAVLGFGGTTVSVIALGSWLRSAFGGGAATEYGTALVIGAVAWAGLNLVPVLGGIVTFVVGTMGYGYLALWLLNGTFGRDYGSYDGSGSNGTTRKARDRYDPDRERADPASPAGGDDERSSGSEDRRDDDRDRFRNLAALDADREDESDDGADEETLDDRGSTDDDGTSTR